MTHGLHGLFVGPHLERSDVLIIRQYRKGDAERVGRLIAETYNHFNLGFLPPESRDQFLGPFRHANSEDPAHREEIARVIEAVMVFVADDEGEIVGVLRGRRDKLQSLFVQGDRHRQGIGRQLVQRFEQACLAAGSGAIKVQSTLYAVPFYTAMGYRKTTGVRHMKSFEGQGLAYQPMKKRLGLKSER
jgi:GNAT superfamily N-acetyltransferase